MSRNEWDLQKLRDYELWLASWVKIEADLEGNLTLMVQEDDRNIYLPFPKDLRLLLVEVEEGGE